jgi:hypothetical protein
MTRLTAGQIYAAARDAGFSPARAVIATAVALAESGGDPAAVGDQTLTNATWGPSVGLWQVRTLKRETGTGGTRDVAALTGDIAAQAKAALSVSGGGSDWTDWTVYNTGAYQQYLGQAQAAANDPAATQVDWRDALPWNAPGAAAGAVKDAIGEVMADSLKPARNIAISIAVVGLGLALVGVGIVRAISPAAKAAQAKVDEARDVAKDVAMAVV